MDSGNLKLLRSQVENINSIPTIPSTLRRLSVIVEKKAVTLEEISRFVSNDPALTSKVLKMVNSAVYGFPGRISSVSHAIMLLGLNVVKGLLLGVSVFEIMQKSMVGLWEHSVSCAVTSRIIAKRKGLAEPDEISVAGLLHDVGKVILNLRYPEIYLEAMKEAAEKEILIGAAEENLFGKSHDTVGMWLTEKWHFPSNLVEAIEYHHKPHLAKLAPMDTAVVHFSDILVRARGLGFAGDALMPALNTTAFEMLNLTEGDIRDILLEIESSIDNSEGLTL
jgi:putative nucleotidyltransferase with HDIG domain